MIKKVPEGLKNERLSVLGNQSRNFCRFGWWINCSKNNPSGTFNRMNKLERVIVYLMLIGQGISLLAVFTYDSSVRSDFHDLIGMVILIRDLYKRDFKNPNDKITWILIIFFTAGIGFVFYAFKHAIKPRGDICASIITRGHS